MEAPATSDAARVPRREGEAARQRLRGLGVLRADLKPRAEGDVLLLPVAEGAREVAPEFAYTRADFEAQPLPRAYQDLARVPAALRPLLPTGFDVVGDIVVVKLPPELEPHRAEVGRALLEAHKGARTVLLDRGVHGEERVRSVEPIAGEPRTTTEHAEHGARFRVDLAQAYFSPRLATERARVAEQAREGEVVLDMFAGVGPFSILLARTGKPQRVYAADINPEAVRLCGENARLNKVQDKVQPVLADGAAFAARIEGQCDRVIMNLPHSADQHWEAALRACKPRATIHYHRILERGQEEAHAAMLRERATRQGWEARVRARRAVRAYSPTQDHLAWDFEVAQDPPPGRSDAKA